MFCCNSTCRAGLTIFCESVHHMPHIQRDEHHRRRHYPFMHILMQHQEPKLSPYILLLFHQRQLWHTPLDGRHSRMVWLGFSSVSVLGHWASPSPFQNIIAITHHGNCGVIVGEGLCPMSSFFPQTLCSPTPCISVIVQCGELPVIYHQSFLYVMKIKRTSIAQAERSTKT